MMRMKNAVLAAGMLLTGVTVALAEPRLAPGFELEDVNGVNYSLGTYAGRVVVLEWTNYDCPFVRKFYDAGAMQALQETYTGKGVVWLSVCSSAPGKQGNLSREQWRSRMEKDGVKATAVLLDPDGTVGKAFDAKTTPHLFVLNPEGRVVYEGAIDSIRSTQSRDIEKADNYVRASLDALLNETPVAVAETQPYGCSVKY